MSKEEDPYRKWLRGDRPQTRSDTQDVDPPLDMEGQEDDETSASVNEDKTEPDEIDERVDENID
jgi:hypothetical protein